VPGERIRLRIGNLAKAVLITGQAYQDPKDALNEFVSNAADDYAESGLRGERVRVVLRRKGRHPAIAVHDDGRGMDAERLRQIARNLFESAKAGDARTIGEKAIGILAFQQIGSRCEIVSRAAGTTETFVLKLERGKASAALERADRRRALGSSGTTVYLSDIDPDVLRVLTQRKVVEYLRRRRGPAIERGDYSIEVIEGHRSELVTPEEPDGVRINLHPRQTLWGRIEFAIYVAPTPERRRRVSVVGRGGTTIIDDIAEIEELDAPPWTTDQVSGLIAFDALQQTAGRRAILRDREAFPMFLDAVRSVEPVVLRHLERVATQVNAEQANRLAEVVRRIFGRVLRELDDVDNPSYSLVGSEPGEGALFAEDASEGRAPGTAGAAPSAVPRDFRPPLPPDETPIEDVEPRRTAAPDRSRTRNLPTVAPDPSPDGVRSRFAPDDGVVYYNDQHEDYLNAKNEEPTLIDYLTTLVAKELVVYNNPRASPFELGEEMVRMLVRVRRHTPRKH
jgi:hypothetical protein